MQVRAPSVTISHRPPSPAAALAWARVWSWLLAPEEEERHPSLCTVSGDALRPATVSPTTHSVAQRRRRAKAAHGHDN